MAGSSCSTRCEHTLSLFLSLSTVTGRWPLYCDGHPTLLALLIGAWSERCMAGPGVCIARRAPAVSSTSRRNVLVTGLSREISSERRGCRSRFSRKFDQNRPVYFGIWHTVITFCDANRAIFRCKQAVLLFVDKRLETNCYRSVTLMFLYCYSLGSSPSGQCHPDTIQPTNETRGSARLEK